MPEFTRDIFEIYERMVGPLSRGRGQSQNVLCFAHVDGTPSLRLDAEKNVARCYSCRRSWTPEQMEAYLTGRQEESVKRTDTSAMIADAFEDEILSKIRSLHLNPRDFIGFFMALDVARYTNGITYESVRQLWKVFEEKVSCTTTEK